MIGDGTVTPELMAKARVAEANFPERAISLVENRDPEGDRLVAYRLN